jgi:hypothetical protein
MYPNWDFWFENIPSGNPGDKAEKGFCLSHEIFLRAKLDSGPTMAFSTNKTNYM